MEERQRTLEGKSVGAATFAARESERVSPETSTVLVDREKDSTAESFRKEQTTPSITE